MTYTATTQRTAREQYRVLVVDDEIEICEILAAVLRSPYRSVEIRDTPRAALEFLEHNPIDLAFVDAKMPGMSGLQLAQRIKAKYPHAHVVICTGYFGVELAMQATTAANVDRVIHKPVKFGEVIALADRYATDSNEVSL